HSGPPGYFAQGEGLRPHLRHEPERRAEQDLLQVDVVVLPDVYDRVIMGGNRFEFPSGRERLREQFKRYFPKEASATDRYIEAVISTQKAVNLYFAEKAIPRPLAWLAGGLMRSRF